MGFLPKKLLRALWGVQQPATTLAQPLDCDACAVARQAGSDACFEHHAAHARPHTYSIGHQVEWGSPFSASNDQMPIRNSESIHSESIH